MGNRGPKEATRTCTFPDCGKEWVARGLCAGHYAQWRMRGGGDKVQLSPLRVPGGNRTITSRVPHETHALLSLLAARNGASLYDLVATVLADFAEAAKGTLTAKERAEAAAAQQ